VDALNTKYIFGYQKIFFHFLVFRVKGESLNGSVAASRDLSLQKENTILEETGQTHPKRRVGKDFNTSSTLDFPHNEGSNSKIEHSGTKEDDQENRPSRESTNNTSSSRASVLARHVEIIYALAGLGDLRENSVGGLVACNNNIGDTVYSSALVILSVSVSELNSLAGSIGMIRNFRYTIAQRNASSSGGELSDHGRRVAVLVGHRLAKVPNVRPAGLSFFDSSVLGGVGEVI